MGRATPDRIERVLQPGTTLWRDLNPSRGAPLNCPATAAAVDHYLRTGRIVPAVSIGADDTFRYSNRPLRGATLPGIYRLLDDEGEYVTVRGRRSPSVLRGTNLTPDHWFQIMRHGNRHIVIDGFLGRVVEDIREYVRQMRFTSYQYYQAEYRVEPVPMGDFFQTVIGEPE
jgi:hypothetical protein